MTHYSKEPKTKNISKDKDFLISQRQEKIIGYCNKTGLKIASKKVVHKTAKTTGQFLKPKSLIKL